MRHETTASRPKGIVSVSLRLSRFLSSRYHTDQQRFRWLCPTCNAFELKAMSIDEFVQLDDGECLRKEESLTREPSVHTNDDDDDDDDCSPDTDFGNRPVKRSSDADSGVLLESEDDDSSHDDDDIGADQSTSEESDGTSYELAFHKDNAAAQLSPIF